MKHFICVPLLVLISCSGPKETSEVNDNNTAAEEVSSISSLLKAEVETVPGDTSKFITIEEKGAISILPDTIWMNDQQKSMDEDTWMTIVDDHVYYDSEAIDTLESIGVKTISPDTNQKQYLKFKLEGGREFSVDLRKVPGAWGFILFNGKDVPELYPSIDVSAVMDSVFRK